MILTGAFYPTLPSTPPRCPWRRPSWFALLGLAVMAPRCDVLHLQCLHTRDVLQSWTDSSEEHGTDALATKRGTVPVTHGC